MCKQFDVDQSLTTGQAAKPSAGKDFTHSTKRETLLAELDNHEAYADPQNPGKAHPKVPAKKPVANPPSTPPAGQQPTPTPAPTPKPTPTPAPTPKPKTAGEIAQENFAKYTEAHALNAEGGAALNAINVHNFVNNDKSATEAAKQEGLRGRFGIGSLKNIVTAAFDKHKGVPPTILNELKGSVSALTETTTTQMNSSAKAGKEAQVDSMAKTSFESALTNYQTLEKIQGLAAKYKVNITQPEGFLRFYKDLRDAGLVKNPDLGSGKDSANQKMDEKFDEYSKGKVKLADTSKKTATDQALADYKANPTDPMLKLIAYQLISGNQK